MKKSKAAAMASFIFGLTFWIPLLNLIFGILAIVMGLKAIYKIKRHPESYGGKWLAVAGILLGSIVYMLSITGIGMCLAGYKDICNFMGLTFLN